MKLAFFEPDIPQNIGAAMRLCACLDVEMHVIEPTSFPWKENEFRRSGLDYVEHIRLIRHSSWAKFQQNMEGARIVLLTTKAAEPYTGFTFDADDVLLMGSESRGVPDDVHNAANARLTIPMKAGLRSLNVVNAASMVLGEALRQTGEFPVFIQGAT